MITAPAADLTVVPGVTSGAAIIAAPADDLTADPAVAPDASGVRCARQHDAGEEAAAQHNRARDGTTATDLGS